MDLTSGLECTSDSLHCVLSQSFTFLSDVSGSFDALESVEELVTDRFGDV